MLYHLFDEVFLGSAMNYKVRSIPYMVYKDKGKSSIELHLAGVKKDRISIDVKEQVLFITVIDEDGEKIKEQRFSLPSSVDASKVRAEHKDGLLIINIYDREAPPTVKIPID